MNRSALRNLITMAYVEPLLNSHDITDVMRAYARTHPRYTAEEAHCVLEHVAKMYADILANAEFLMAVLDGDASMELHNGRLYLTKEGDNGNR